MDLDLRLVASFLMLVKERHYGRAASRLHVSASSLSRRIQALERQVGISLIVRGPVGVVALTSAGQRFAAAAVPLMAGARAAREAARNDPLQYPLRFGVPAGTGGCLMHFDMPNIVRGLQIGYPEARVEYLNVPFPELTRSLVESRVDVLWTVAPVRHAMVDTFPLSITSARIGLVGAEHRFAEAEAVDVEVFSDEVMRYSPLVPAEWMSLFWLADIRPRREARLMGIDVRDLSTALRRTADDTAVTTSLELIIPQLSRRVRAVSLKGAAPVVFHVARRRTDERSAVRALIDALRALGPLQLSG